MFTFPFLSDRIDQRTNFAKLLCSKMAFLDITVNFITQKLKSKHLAISVFSSQSFFEGTRGKFFHIFRALIASVSISGFWFQSNSSQQPAEQILKQES